MSLVQITDQAEIYIQKHEGDVSNLMYTPKPSMPLI